MAEASKVPATPRSRDHEPPAHRLSSWPPFESLHHEIDRLFDDVAHGFGGFLPRRRFSDRSSYLRNLALPTVDIREKEKAYQLTAELPGMGAGNIEVAVGNDMLTIAGEKREETEEKDKRYHLSERRFGSFQRAFRLPPDIDQSKIEANLHSGVLTVVLPKAPEARSRTRKIAVKPS
jgi:HSP20 family protein